MKMQHNLSEPLGYNKGTAKRKFIAISIYIKKERERELK
jgi:hypothetical protein